MTDLFIELLKASGANWAHFIIILMGMCVVLYINCMRVEIKRMKHTAAQHDKLILLYGHLIKINFNVTSVKVHRNGDYEIAQPLNDD